MDTPFLLSGLELGIGVTLESGCPGLRPLVVVVALSGPQGFNFVSVLCTQGGSWFGE